MSKSKIKKQRIKWMKFLIALLAVFATVLLYFWDSAMVSEAVWIEYNEETGSMADSSKYQVWTVASRNDTSTVPTPEFEISDYKISSTDRPTIPEGTATISNIGKCQPGDSFTITPNPPAAIAADFHPENVSYTSSNTNIVTVTSNRGNAVVTVIGPGVATIGWTYTYQRYCKETVTETSESIDEDGNTIEVPVTRDYEYYETTSIQGSFSGDINPQIDKQSVYLYSMQPGDTMELRTNVPNAAINNAEVLFSTDTAGLLASDPYLKEGSDGYVYISATASNAGLVGTITVTISLRDAKVLRSEPVTIVVTEEFEITPNYHKMNCVTYNSSGVPSNNQIPITVQSNSNEPITWEYEDEEGNVTEITSGANGMYLSVNSSSASDYDGLKATINGNRLVLETSASFFDYLTEGDSSYQFTIRAKQKFSDETTYVGESDIVITRPVQDVVIYRNGSSTPINSRQELYAQIGYTTNGNGISVPQERFVADPDVLVARVSGLGDETIQVSGTADNSIVSTYRFNHLPADAEVEWSTTDSNVVKITNSSQGGNTSTCSLLAAGPGRATVTAVTKDGGFIYSVEYIVRPYPQTVTMKDTEIYERLGELNSKQVSLVAYITSNDQVENPAQDTYLDTGLKWEISSVNSANGESIGSVDQKGVLTFTGPGTIVVRATSTVDHNGFSGYAPFAVCTVTIEQPIERITIINKPTDPIMTGDIWALKTRIEPTNATDQSVTWTSANTSIATVDKDGKVTAVGPGSTTIRVQTNSGAKYDTCTIEVRRLAQSITLNRSEAKVSRGKKLTLLATVLPEDTTDKTVTWTTSDKSIATVSDKGVVTGVKVSKDPVIITATTSNGKSAECYVTVTEPVTGIKVSPKTKTIYVGKTFTIKKAIYPLGNDSVNSNVTWKTSNSKVATVNKNGVVTPKAGGKCTITCTTEDGNYTAKCVVTVKELVTSIKLNKSKLSLKIGASYKLTASVLRRTATNRKVTWSSSNSKIVSVSKTGKLKGLKLGKATITVKAQDGSGVKATCKVTVVRKVSSLKLNKAYITLITGYRYKTLKATVLPKDATNKKLLWSTSNSKIVSVKKNTGTMFAESAGTAYITVRTTDGSKLSKRCRVKVIDPVPITSLTISQSEITLVNGSKSQLEVRTVPTNTTSAVRWMTDDRSIATVSSNGMITANKPGTTTITAYCNEGIESQCTVTVIQMNPSAIAIEQYDQYSLAVDGAEDGTITWNSSNANIVKVDSSGKVTGVKPGIATIYATYKGKKVSCSVTVKNIP